MKTRHGLIALTLLSAASLTAIADTAYQALPFSQDWSNTGLITVNDNWSGVPGITGYLGDSDAGSPTGVDPTTLTADVAVAVDVIANQTNPNTNTAGGVGEFEIANGGVALQGSGTADAPFIKLFLNTTGLSNIGLAYTVRDIDGAADNAVQQVAAQYRVGNAGAWTNIAGTYIADATQGPSLSGFETPISVTLPSAVDNQAQVEVRILTTNAAGSDEWVAIRNISVTGVAPPAPGASTWGMIALAAMIAASGAAMMLRRRATSVA